MIHDIFLCAYLLSIHLYGKISFKIICPFKKNQVGFFSSYCSGTSPLSDMSFGMIFFCVCLFIVFTVAFEEQKVLILMKCHLSNFSFINYAFGGVFKKTFA